MGQEVRRSGPGIAAQVRRHAPYPCEELLGEHRVRRAVGEDAAVGQDHDPVGEPGGEVEVVQGRHHRDPTLSGEGADPTQQIQLVPDVQVGRGLIKEQ